MRKIFVIIALIPLSTIGQVICPCDSFDYYWGGDTINLIVNDQRQGLWVDYDQIIAFIDGIECRGGKAISNYTIKSKGNYLDNKRDGNWTFYHTDTIISRYAKYDNGKLDSVDTSYDFKGIIVSQIFWDSGAKDSVIVYYSDRSIRYKGYYDSGRFTDFVIYYPGGDIKLKANGLVNTNPTSIEYFDDNGNGLKLRNNDFTMIMLTDDLLKFID